MFISKKKDKKRGNGFDAVRNNDGGCVVLAIKSILQELAHDDVPEYIFCNSELLHS